MNIEANVQRKLVEAIRSLLNAGRDTGNIAQVLSAQASFGKYDGCHPTAIKEIANGICREMNAEASKVDREIARVAVALLKEQFPDISKYFKS